MKYCMCVDQAGIFACIHHGVGKSCRFGIKLTTIYVCEITGFVHDYLKIYQS